VDNKAPGPDGIPNKVLKIAIKANSKEYVENAAAGTHTKREQAGGGAIFI